MKGIILAGGRGTRLFPLTTAVSKQLMPVYNKPMVYYPLSTLLLAGIRDVLLVTAPADREQFERLLGDGSQWGVRLSYAVQERPEGIAHALLVGREFIGRDPVCLILGDNIFHGHGLPEILRRAAGLRRGALVFGCRVSDPRQYGVVEFDGSGRAVSLEEKPARPRSPYAVPGLYFYDGECIGLAEQLQPSGRGELEITDLNRAYLERGQLQVEVLGRGFAWLDTGTHESLYQATNFIRTLEERQGLMVACLEEIAYRLGYISLEQLCVQAQQQAKSDYGRYLLELCEEYSYKAGVNGRELPILSGAVNSPR